MACDAIILVGTAVRYKNAYGVKKANYKYFTQKFMKSCSTLLVIREIKNKIIIDTNLWSLKYQKLKTLAILDVGKVEEQGNSHILLAEDKLDELMENNWHKYES